MPNVCYNGDWKDRPAQWLYGLFLGLMLLCLLANAWRLHELEREVVSLTESTEIMTVAKVLVTQEQLEFLTRADRLLDRLEEVERRLTQSIPERRKWTVQRWGKK